MKMFIKGKSIRFRFKWWCLCGTDGFPYHIKLYAGREAVADAQALGTKMVNHMLEVIEKHSEVKFHHLFFDNFFSSHALMKSLTDKHVAATGTIRELRTGGAQKELRDTTDMRKLGRGASLTIAVMEVFSW